MGDGIQMQLLSPSEQIALLRLARASLVHFLGTKKQMQVEDMEEYLAGTTCRQPYNCFVTIQYQRQLRGCIGTIRADKPLYQAVAHSAVNAGVNDPRFRPMDLMELTDCDIEISVLSHFQRIQSIDEIEVGRHGLLLQMELHRGLLLPQVAMRFAWDAKEFVRQTFLKAGARGDFEPGQTDLSTFEAQIFSETQYRTQP